MSPVCLVPIVPILKLEAGPAEKIQISLWYVQISKLVCSSHKDKRFDLSLLPLAAGLLEELSIDQQWSSTGTISVNKNSDTSHIHQGMETFVFI